MGKVIEFKVKSEEIPLEDIAQTILNYRSMDINTLMVYCYYVYVAFIVYNGYVITREPIYAYEKGPYAEEVMKKYMIYNGNIPKIDVIPESVLNNDYAYYVIESTYDSYSKLSDNALKYMIKNEVPYNIALEESLRGGSSEIQKSDILDFYNDINI